MALSSNTILHFTSSKEALKGILTENFKLKYCKETIKWKEQSEYVLHVPMVSFCDIPLSQIKNHISNYGDYGIGLSREWAKKNKLNPVLYIEPGSNLSTSYKNFLGSFLELRKERRVNDEISKQLIDVIRYFKNYEGPLLRGGNTKENYRFSDEREWRYVPDYKSPCEMIYTNAQFSEKGIKEEAANSISEMRLTFTPNDVKYIIIKNDDEIGEFIEHLRRAKGKTYTHEETERLSTRLLTSEQIHDDI